MAFDIYKFLEEYSIDYKDRGKGTTRGWVQVRECPFCLNDNYHLGYNINKNFFHCWVCGNSGKPEFLVYKLLKTTYTTAQKIYRRYSSDFDLYEEGEQVIYSDNVDVKWDPFLHKIHSEYLASRNYDPLFIQRRYMVGSCYTVGRFPYSLVMPIYDDGQLVNATSRDVTGKQTEKYLSLSNEESVLNIKKCVYNIDNAKENILIVEGPFDMWRMGGSTVALFGIDFESYQVNRILSKFPENIYVMFDNEFEAQKKAKKLCSCFSPFVKNVENIEIDTKDPASFTQEEALTIRNELGI